MHIFFLFHFIHQMYGRLLNYRYLTNYIFKKKPKILSIGIIAVIYSERHLYHSRIQSLLSYKTQHRLERAVPIRANCFVDLSFNFLSYDTIKILKKVVGCRTFFFFKSLKYYSIFCILNARNRNNNHKSCFSTVY